MAFDRPGGRQGEGGRTLLEAHSSKKLRAVAGRSGTSVPKRQPRPDGGQYLPVRTLELGEDIGLESGERGKVGEPIWEKLPLPQRLKLEMGW